MEENPKLTNDQMEEVKKEMVSNGIPVRFLHQGCCLDIITGHLQKKGINIIHQRHYWTFTRETSLKIAKWLGVAAEFSE
ncbi:MAG: hypothetical protein ACLQF0_06775 [Dissulfurispiraceae bacterium]